MILMFSLSEKSKLLSLYLLSSLLSRGGVGRRPSQTLKDQAKDMTKHQDALNQQREDVRRWDKTIRNHQFHSSSINTAGLLLHSSEGLEGLETSVCLLLRPPSP